MCVVSRPVGVLAELQSVTIRSFIDGPDQRGWRRTARLAAFNADDANGVRSEANTRARTFATLLPR